MNPYSTLHSSPKKVGHRMSRLVNKGFTLIEITLALGVVAFAFVTVFGLLSVSMNMVNTSMEHTNASRISQTLINMIQQTPFDQQSNRVGEIFYFDMDGELLDLPQRGSFVYTATILNVPGNLSDRSLSSTTNRAYAVRIARNREVSTDVNDPYILGPAGNYFYQVSFITSDMRQ